MKKMKGEFKPVNSEDMLLDKLIEELENSVNNVKEFIRLERKILYEIFKSWEIDENVIQSIIVSLDKLAEDKLK